MGLSDPPEGSRPMRPQPIAALVSLTLGACAAAGPPAVPVDRTEWSQPERVAEDAGAQVLTVVGTPFYALFKGVACVASTLLAAPASAGLALSDRPDRDIVRAHLNEGVGQNCGGSYVLGNS
jgi:hypothetical protein